MSAFDFDKVIYVDGTLVWRVAPRRGVPAGKVIGRVTSNGYRRVSVAGVGYGVHRLVWEMHYGPIPEGMEIDHINGVRDDNAVENLRMATRAENGWNHKMHRQNTQGIKGLGTRVRGRCVEYTGRIRVHGKVYFKSSIDRKVVVDWLEQMRPILHGDYANGGHH